MTGIYIIAVLLISQVNSEVVELSCADNATCLNHLGRQLYTSIKQHKTVRLFDLITIEPIRTRESRSYKGPLTRLLTSHAISFDWNDFTFRLSNPEDKDDSMDLEVFENRSSKDEPETIPKKTAVKAEDELEDKLPKSRIKRKRPKKKVLQAVIPLLFGMKSTGAIIFAMALVTAITMKAFFASKLALLVTIGMAMKKLYESYSNGIGLPNNPYLYSQYPIDFPSASSQGYSVNGVNTQFASPDMYNPTAVGSQSHSHEIIHQNEVTAQQSQQAPTLLLNSTRSASERWDGYRGRPMFYGTSRATSESYSAYQKSRR
ncbi:PREDICTED: uncharacterized protein LOC106116241 isoform X1 [Papilio xuthus]|uniref:Uncharacterized protein LOC106116241 isoform X1 n=1 Tax=Papilio xuthus TaxID=66420 RepID=A0AAJ6Z4X2_PAPXU|nr:PREDICTED: uncharacterized protein LOC106116241 isoform X1 [Papilio xuthus]